MDNWDSNEVAASLVKSLIGRSATFLNMSSIFRQSGEEGKAFLYVWMESSCGDATKSLSVIYQTI